MERMIDSLCRECRNYFLGENARDNIHVGRFNISGGQIAPSEFLKDGQYFRIVGSTLNDGVYRYPVADLTDESFDGAVWAMNVPPSFIALSADIEKYMASDEGKPSPYASESFGGYSYTRATGKNGLPLAWQNVFSREINAYRRYNVL